MSESRPVTLITGGTRGLGRAISKRLASQGHLVVLNFRSSVSGAESLMKEIGTRCRIFKADISSAGDVNKMADFIRTAFGKLDNLINNAGITADGLLIKYSEKEWDNIIDINLKGCFNCIQAMVPLMEGAEGGHIINISSYSGLKGKEGQPAYSASKAGIIGLGRSLAKELSDRNIRVNTILPGYMETAMGANTKKAMARAKRESLLDTLSDPVEVAGFVAYLCSTRHITGQIFSLDSRIV